jgi:chemotaxis protein methyltransferase CheR
MAGDSTAMAGAADSQIARQYEFSDQDFQRVRRIVYEQLGIALSDSKRQLVYGRLTRRLRALQLREFDTYLQRVEGGDAVEMEHFRNAITTNLTSFFRENHHFEFLAQQLLPQLALQNGASAWCASGMYASWQPTSIPTCWSMRDAASMLLTDWRRWTAPDCSAGSILDRR